MEGLPFPWPFTCPGHALRVHRAGGGSNLETPAGSWASRLRRLCTCVYVCSFPIHVPTAPFLDRCFSCPLLWLLGLAWCGEGTHNCQCLPTNLQPLHSLFSHAGSHRSCPTVGTPSRMEEGARVGGGGRTRPRDKPKRALPVRADETDLNASFCPAPHRDCQGTNPPVQQRAQQACHYDGLPIGTSSSARASASKVTADKGASTVTNCPTHLYALSPLPPTA